LIARLLVQHGRKVRALARDPARARTQLDPAVEIVRGDITNEATLRPAVEGTSHIIFTAGRRSGRPFTAGQIQRTEYGGVVNTLTAARDIGYAGRFLYMTASGTDRQSFWSLALNLYKGNTLRWRKRAEADIRASGLPYTIIRTGILTNQPGGTRAIEVTQHPLPLSPRYRIAREDVAAVFVAALEHPQTIRATFEIVWGKGPASRRWADLFDGLQSDEALARTAHEALTPVQRAAPLRNQR
jgi:uncharacterized protein YbjT (DUF2867 family)